MAARKLKALPSGERTGQYAVQVENHLVVVARAGLMADKELYELDPLVGFAAGSGVVVTELPERLLSDSGTVWCADQRSAIRAAQDRARAMPPLFEYGVWLVRDKDGTPVEAYIDRFPIGAGDDEEREPVIALDADGSLDQSIEVPVNATPGRGPLSFGQAVEFATDALRWPNISKLPTSEVTAA
jgi:hypothetical protein